MLAGSAEKANPAVHVASDATREQEDEVTQGVPRGTGAGLNGPKCRPRHRPEKVIQLGTKVSFPTSPSSRPGRAVHRMQRTLCPGVGGNQDHILDECPTLGSTGKATAPGAASETRLGHTCGREAAPQSHACGFCLSTRGCWTDRPPSSPEHGHFREMSGNFTLKGKRLLWRHKCES